MKRSISCDSDNDVFYDDSDTYKDRSPSQSCHRSDRKRRRGVIEKRRRDRINNSLTELRRLVPAAFEKQDSAKLEKAEILQMTVDHLKSLHSKALGGSYNIDTAAMAMDYRLVGFRECAAEVARYLVSIEGLDLQDPLRLRLISHLQCYCAQREVAAKSATALPPVPSHHTWNHPQYAGPPPGMMGHQHGGGGGQSDQSAAAYLDPSRALGQSHHGDHNGMRLTSSANMTSQMTGMSCSSSSAPSMMSAGVQSAGGGSLLTSLAPSVYPAAQFLGGNTMPMLSPNGLHYSASSNILGHGMKPYRPWGSELAY